MLSGNVSSASSSSSAIGQQVASGSRSSLLMSRIEFTPGEYECSLAAQALQSKYHLLTPKDKLQKMSSGGDATNGQPRKNTDANQTQGVLKQQRMLNGGGRSSEGDGMPLPRVQLYPPANVHLEWQQSHKIGAGLVNLGNTCFMNTVIQCLTYCPPLVNYLLHGDHAAKCRVQGFCMMCELQKHMKRTLDRPNEVIKPLYIYQKLKSIAKHFQFGRQEDAHEFLRYVVDNMWKASLSNFEAGCKLDPASKETTVVNQIFGGYHRSQVICLQCKEKSNTYDHFMDFILDIKQNVSSLEKALEKFVLPELLQNENAYKCPRCNMKVPAQKRFTVHRPPNVATFQLKRFDYNRMLGGKITKHVTYPEKLDLRPFMSEHKGSPVPYRLNAVLVHLGASCNSGHYFCYVRNCNGSWYLMDDAKVHQVSLNQVLNQQAYVLFYVRVPTNNQSSKKSPPSQPSHKVLNSLTNGSLVDAPELRGSPAHRVAKLPLSSSSSASSSSVSLSNGSIADSSVGALPNAREKVVFGIRRPQLGDSTFSVASSGSSSSVKASSLKKQMSDPLSNGTVTTTSCAAQKCLVPYTGDSSDSSDTDQKMPRKDAALSQESDGSSSSLVASKAPFHRNSYLTYGVLKSAGDLASSLSLAAAKVKATGVWHVSDGSMHSPSVASESSTNSVNSTTDWNVSEHQDATSRSSSAASKSERVYAGWKVTASAGDRQAEAKAMTSTAAATTTTTSTASVRDANVAASEEGPVTSADTEGPSKSRCLPGCTRKVSSCPSEDQSFPAAKANSKRSTPDAPGGSRGSKGDEADDSGDHHGDPVPKRREPQLHDDGAQGDRPLREKRKKKGSLDHQDDRRLSAAKERKRERSAPCARPPPPPPLGPTEQPARCRHQHEPAGDGRLGGDGPHWKWLKSKRHSSSSSSSDELEWVEKTKETLEAERKQKEACAPVKHWDSEWKDGSHKSRHQHHNGVEATWNGTYAKSPVVEKLLKSSSRGYGNGVSSWNGDTSHVDRDIIYSERKRHHNYSDDEDDEYDRGKAKKVRHHRSSHPALPYNPFQRLQEQRYSSSLQDTRHQPSKYRSSSGSHYRNSNHYHRHYRSNNH